MCIFFFSKPGQCSRYSDWLRAERPRGRSSSPGRGNCFLPSTSSRPVPGTTQPIFQWGTGTMYPGLKRPGSEADHSPPTSEYVSLYIHCPIRLHGVVLN
jgi:hypothetical protein